MVLATIVQIFGDRHGLVLGADRIPGGIRGPALSHDDPRPGPIPLAHAVIYFVGFSPTPR